MLKLLKLLEKNFKLLWKSKLFILTILVGPLLMAILLGMAFNNTDVYSVNVGVYTDDYNNLKNKIVDRLNENFKVLKFQDEGSCLKALKDYSAHVCLGLPSNMAKGSNEVSEIIFYVDNSRMNLVWMILDSLSGILEKSSSEISMELTKELLFKLEEVREDSLNLKELTKEAINSSNQSLLQAKEVSSDIDSLDMAGTQTQVENSLSQSKEIEEEWVSFKRKMEGKISESTVILSEINSNISGLDEAKDKLEEMNDLLKSDLPVAELGSLLTELDSKIFEIRNTLATDLDKTDEVKTSLANSLGCLKQIQTTVEEMAEEVEKVQVTNASKIVNPIITEIRPINKEGTYFSFIYPTLIILIIVFTSILLSSSMIVKERKSQAFFRNYVSSTSELMFSLTYFLTGLILVSGSLFVFVIFAKILFDAPLNFALFLVLVLLISLFILLGGLIGYAAKSEQSNILLGLTVASVLLFFSNTILPVEGASGILKGIIKFNPLVLGEVILRKLLVYGLGLGSVGNDLLLLLVYTLVLAAVLFLSLKFFHRRDFKFRKKRN